VFIATAIAICSLQWPSRIGTGLMGTGCCTLPAVSRSTQPSTLHGAVKRVSAFGLSNNKMATAEVDGISILVNTQPESAGLDYVMAATWSWIHIHQMKRVNSRNGAVP